ncbi:MAG: hypothetical protein ABSG95_03835 [Solirubrobacteraceae bacterium]
MARSNGRAQIGAADRARDWRHAAQAALCDVVRPCKHARIVGAASYPSYPLFNVMPLEENPTMGVNAMSARLGFRPACTTMGVLKAALCGPLTSESRSR